MAIRPNTVLYFDTNALRALRFEKEISVLLDASKSGEANISVSEWVIYEYARQAFNRQIDAPISQVALIEKSSGKRRQDILRGETQRRPRRARQSPDPGNGANGKTPGTTIRRGRPISPLARLEG